jgi:DNA-binding MarR family transcriptional regulator
VVEAGVKPGVAALPDGLGHDLGWLLGQVQHGYLAAAFAAVGALPGGMKGLYVLGAAAEGDAHNQIELARRFGIDRTVMVRLVDDLERAGLVERRPDPADRRARLVTATERGVATHGAVQERMDMVADHVLAPLSPAQRAVFADMLRRVAAHLISIDPTHGAAACDAVRDQFPGLEPACGGGDQPSR